MRRALLSAALAGMAVPAAAEVRIRRAQRPLTDGWRRIAVEARGLTTLGVSFRPLQARALGLDPRAALMQLLPLEFEVLRLAAHWDAIETHPGDLRADDLDWQIEAAARAGKQIVLCVGAVKAFGYPELFVPAHRLNAPLPEHTVIGAETHGALLEAAIDFVTRMVGRYRDRPEIIAWQVEHEAVDPLGLEHSWRLSTAFLEAEIAAVRAADPDRPVLLNGFLPASLPVRLQQWWRTRGQGDSLSVAEHLADVVGVDYYPRHALLGVGPLAMYLDGHNSPWPARRLTALLARAQQRGQRVIVSEGQAEPWETATTPPSPAGGGMSSCLPEHVIENYNRCMAVANGCGVRLSSYLFWGAEYWLQRQQGGDPRYLEAFKRVLDDA